jgi:hypothetical protein
MYTVPGEPTEPGKPAKPQNIAEITINRAVVEGKRSPLIRKKQDKTAA